MYGMKNKYSSCWESDPGQQYEANQDKREKIANQGLLAWAPSALTTDQQAITSSHNKRVFLSSLGEMF